jgi:hypothetical protein
VAGRGLRKMSSPKFRLVPNAKYRAKVKWAEPMKPVDKSAAEQVCVSQLSLCHTQLSPATENAVNLVIYHSQTVKRQGSSCVTMDRWTRALTPPF